MYIRFEDDITIYSFNEKELSKLEEIYKVFQEYGKVDLKSIRVILSSEFAVKIIPLFYKVYMKMIDNVRIDLPEEYVEGILNNEILYTEYGLLMEYYCGRKHSNMLPDDVPDYLMNEINKYTVVDGRYQTTFVTYNRPKSLYKNLNIEFTRPYKQDDYDIEEKNEKYW